MNSQWNRTPLALLAPIAALCFAAVLTACGDSAEVNSALRDEAFNGCVLIVRMPPQDKPLADILVELPTGGLLASPTGQDYDIAFYNGASPAVQVDRPALEPAEVEADIRELSDWVEANPTYRASVVRPVEQDECAGA